MDPTSACNLHCSGCWAAEYGHKLNLSLETIDSIVRQGKELGIYTSRENAERDAGIYRRCIPKTAAIEVVWIGEESHAR